MRFPLVCLAMFFASQAFAANDAEIVMLSGKGEKRDAEAAPWTGAAVKQTVRPGGFVRTLANSQMGLLLADRTQMRLNQNSQLQIKSVTDSADWAQTTVRLNAGRAWSQARPQAPSGAPPPPAATGRLTMETSSATMSIRGTDWEVEILPDGSTQLVVLSGTVDMNNEQGGLQVGKGEAAVAAPGKAPVKITLINPQQRVQWVSYWRAQAGRWGGTDADAAMRLAADERAVQGDFSGAIGLLETRAAAGRGEPLTLALLARMLARDERMNEARRMVGEALIRTPAHPELLLAAGDLAIVDGDSAGARSAFTRALAQAPELAEAWYGIGLIESEREQVGSARAALDRSLRSAPGNGVARAERAIVETFAGELRQARSMFDQVLASEPENFVALTAFGVNLLKSGQPAQALEAFLKAGTIEPRYARAWLYSGVAFYQLDERARALEAFARAAELDPKDPLPHLVTSVVMADALEYGEAIMAAQRAQERMPYLKSLNQVANDQKGSANIGVGLANFGMQEWATFYANAAYSPFWAGSHLFLADRYTGKYAKNSELFKGFLTDPTVFGASNRNSSLVTAPGHFGKLDLYFERAAWKQQSFTGTANGLSVDPVPVAYFVTGDFSQSWNREDPSSGKGRNVTVGLGAKPRHDLGLFAFATDSDSSADVRSPSLANDRLKLNDTRADVGANLKFRADNQLWLKVGIGRQASGMSGSFISQPTATSLNRLFGVTIFRAGGILDKYQTINEQRDFQVRHSVGGDDSTLSWGLELSRLARPGELVATFTPVRQRFAQNQAMGSTDAYFSGKWKRLGAFSIQADLWLQGGKMNRTDLATLDVLTTAALDFTLQNIPREQRYADLNPRFGVTWHGGPLQTVRLAAQRWRRPAAISSLAPIDTEGVAVNDRLPVAGGLYTRTRLQFDREFGGRWYLQAFVDHERIDNGINGITSIVPELDLSQLESLRNRRDVFTPVADIEDTAQFTQGLVDTIGVAGNLLVNPRQTLSVRYLNRAQRQIGANARLSIPYLPRHMLRATSNWALPDRWLVGASAIYRSDRFRDAANTQLLKQGWALGMTAYWESADKRSSVQAILDNLLSDKAAATSNKSNFTIRYSYRF